MKKRKNRSPFDLKRSPFLVLFGLISSFSYIHAQSVDSPKKIDKIERDIVKYLQSNEGLEVLSSHKEYKQRMTIIECVDKTVLGYSKVGIYAFSVNRSHSKTYLLLKNELKHQIVDPTNLIETLQKTTTLLLQEKIPDSKVIEYIEYVIKSHKMNENMNPANFER